MSEARRRLVVIGCSSLGLILALAAHLYRMQVVEGASWRRRAAETTLRREWIPAARGWLLDRRGRVLVANRVRYDLRVIPGEVRPGTIPLLARILGVDGEKLSRRIAAAPRHEELEVAHGLDPQRFARLAELQPRLAGVLLEARQHRVHAFGIMASHVLGYTGEISADELRARRGKGYAAGDGIGKAGLERAYDGVLRGQKGARYIAVDPAGRDVRVVETRPPVAGPDLHLTLDAALQARTEAALAEALAGSSGGGAVVVMDARSGAIRALASLPQYDARAFEGRVPFDAYAALLADRRYPLIARAWQSAWSPGSTFKLVTASAALQEGLCTPSDVFWCGGSYAGASCFVRSGHGGISFSDALALSCDVVFYRLGDALGIGRLARYAAAFGVGRRTGVDLPAEDAGLLPTPAWKKPEDWYPGDTINTSIGQGFLVVSPLQVAVYTAAVANGGRVVRPFLVERVGRSRMPLVPPRKVPVKANWLAAVRAGMRGAVTHGTSVAADVPGLTVAGKTGTVENLPTADNPEGRNHVWFTCFAPYEKPEIVVVVFLEKAGGYGGSLAAPVARKVLEAWRRP